MTDDTTYQSLLHRLKSNRDRILTQIREAERAAGREAGSTSLLAVVKRRSDTTVRALAELGQIEIAENRVHALRERAESTWDGLAVHMIGGLQTNKARRAVEGFHTIHSVDRPKLATVLHEEALRAQRVLPIFLQVNIGREPQKGGVEPENAAALADSIRELGGLQLRGLMAMAPRTPDPSDTRPFFAELRDLSDRLRATGTLPVHASELSMGMSRDFPFAIAEGATCVRVGTLLYEGIDESSPAWSLPGGSGLE